MQGSGLTRPSWGIARPRGISNFEFATPNLHPPPGAPSRRGAVAEGLVARHARRREMAVACDRQIAAYRRPQQRPGATAPWAAQPPRRPRAPKDRTTPRETAAKRRFRDRDEIGPLGAFLRLERRREARVSHQLSSRGQRGAVPSGVYDPRGAESYLTVHRAPRGEKTPLGAVHRWPQQKVGEKCGLRPSGHPDRVEGGKRGQRSGIGAIPYREGGAVLLECSPPARRRRAAGEVDGSDESLLSEETSAEAAWP